MPTAKRKPSTTITRSQQLYLRCPTCGAGPWRECVLADGATHKKTAYAPSEAFTELVMGLENKAADAVYKAIGRTRRPNSQDSYDDDGTLSVYIPVDTVKDVTKVRDLLDREGRSYDFAPYVTANGLALLPKGVNGPIFKTDGSGFQRGSDLDEWIEEHAPKAKAKRAPRKRTR